MTLSQNQWEKEYLADGVSVGPYGIPFPFQSTADLRFFGITAAGVATLRTPQTVVKFDNAVGGTFTLAGSPVVSGGRVRVERVPPATQSLDLIAKGSLQPDLIEQELDRVQMQIQELRGRLTRLVGLPDLLALRGANLPAPQGNFLLGWNADSTGFKNFDPSAFTGGGGGGGVSDHGLLTGLADDDHTQYHNDARGLSWATALSAEAPTNQLEIDAAVLAGVNVPDPVYRRPWANVDHGHTVDDVQGLAPLLSGNVKDVDGQASYMRQTTPLETNGAYTFAAGVLTLRIDTGQYFYVRLSANVTSVVLSRGVRDAPAAGWTEAIALFVQQPASGTATYTMTFGSSFKFPDDTPVQPSTGNDISTLYRITRATASTTAYVETIVGYAAPDIPDVPGGGLDAALPYGGAFYGNGTTASRAGNIEVRARGGTAQIAAATFFAWRPGNITGITYHNRLNVTEYTSGTATGYGNGRVNAYIELRPVLPSGLPDMTTLLGRTANFVPRDQPITKGVTRDFISPVVIPTGGRMIAMVYRIADTDYDNTGQNAYDHSWCLNNVIRQKAPIPNMGPWYGVMRSFQGTNNGATWTEFKTSYTAEAYRGTHAWMGQLVYDDGKNIGQPYVFGDIYPTNAVNIVDGTSNKVRQVWKMPAGQAFTAKGVWIYCFARDPAPALTVTVANFGSTTLTTKAVAAASITRFASTYTAVQCIHGSTDGAPDAGTSERIAWVYVAFDAPVTFAAGNKYEIIFTATSGSKVHFWPTASGVKSSSWNLTAGESFGSDDANTKCQYMTNGSTWNDWPLGSGSSVGSVQDLPCLFVKS